MKRQPAASNRAGAVIYGLYRLLWGVAGCLPLPVAWRIGRWVGGWAPWLLPGYHRLVRNNLRIAFGEEWDDKQISDCAREHWRVLTANLLAGPAIHRLSAEAIRDRVEIKNIQFLTDALAEERGVVMVIAHLGNWELFAQLAPELPGRRLSTIYQALGNSLIDAHVREVRARFGVEMFDRKKDLRKAAGILSEGGLVGILIDQHAGDQGIWTPFFGRLASTSPLAATLCRRTGAIPVPVSIYSQPDGKWEVVVGKPLAEHVEDPAEATACFNRNLEERIRVAPADWFWAHNRWKTPEPAFLLKRAKRGVHSHGSLKPFRVVVRSCNWLGDCVMTLPALRMLKRGRPDLHLTILTPSKLAGFWKACVEVDEVLEIPGNGSIRAAARVLKQDHFDAGVLLPNSPRTALEMVLGGVPHRVGRRGKWRAWLLNEIHSPPARSGPPRHQKQDYIDLIRFLGGQREDATEEPFFRIEPTPAPEPLGVICPGAEYGPAKRWPAGRFAGVLNELKDGDSLRWVVVGTVRDKEVAAEVLGSTDVAVEDLTGQTSLEELMRLLAKARVLVTNDTGTMHLGAVLGTPLVAVFGSTEPRLTGPLGRNHRILRKQVECSPCFLRECPLDFRCMHGVEVSDTADAVREMLRTTAP